MTIKNWHIKDVIFSSSERQRAGQHILRMMSQGWGEFSGHVDDEGLAWGEMCEAHGDGMEIVQIHKT